MNYLALIIILFIIDLKSQSITTNTLSRKFIDSKLGYHLLNQKSSVIGLRTFGGASVFIITTVNALELTKDDFNNTAR
jgi:hypothetical protein